MKTDFRVRTAVARLAAAVADPRTVLEFAGHCLQPRQPSFHPGWHLSAVARGQPRLSLRPGQVRTNLQLAPPFMTQDLTISQQQIAHSSFRAPPEHCPHRIKSSRQLAAIRRRRWPRHSDERAPPYCALPLLVPIACLVHSIRAGWASVRCRNWPSSRSVAHAVDPGCRRRRRAGICAFRTP